jgi:HSP20 family protein
MFLMAPWRKETAWEKNYPPALMREEFKTLFDRFFGGWPTPLEPETARFWNLEMEETEKEVMVRAEAPGFEAEEFHVEVRGDTLMLKAEHKHEKKEKEKEYEYAERKYERYVTLPASVAPEKVEAVYRNGVLEVRLPKTEEAKAFRVLVKK